MAGAYSVSQVNAYIKNLFVQDFALNKLEVKGEVSNCKYHSRGHIYFTLKDAASALSAVMFAGNRAGLDFSLSEGMKVVVKGSVEVYERDGKYQLYAKEIKREGIGDLYERFLKLRQDLEEMGMFSPEYKKPIPKYSKRIGIVTAPTGAAVRDIENLAGSKNPYVELILYPALVQGEHAKESIVKGIQTLDQMGLDVLIVGRGGGSIEDLWAFNEEVVARAIFQCNTPVISAVGHETDVTIADYVADMRAPTPSAAAVLAVFDYRLFEEQREAYQKALSTAMERKLEQHRSQIRQSALRLKLFDPRRSIRQRRQTLADWEEKLGNLMRYKAEGERLKVIQRGLLLKHLMEKQAVKDRHRLELSVSRLHGLSPLKRIGGGYGFVTDGKDRRMESVRQVKTGDRINIRIRDGKVEAEVCGVVPEEQEIGADGGKKRKNH